MKSNWTISATTPLDFIADRDNCVLTPLLFIDIAVPSPFIDVIAMMIDAGHALPTPITPGRDKKPWLRACDTPAPPMPEARWQDMMRCRHCDVIVISWSLAFQDSSTADFNIHAGELPSTAFRYSMHTDAPPSGFSPVCITGAEWDYFYAYMTLHAGDGDIEGAYHTSI